MPPPPEMKWAQQAPKCHVRKTQCSSRPGGQVHFQKRPRPRSVLRWSSRREVGEEPPSQCSCETLLKAQGVALTLRQPGYTHSEGRLNQPSFGHSPTQPAPRPLPPPVQPTAGSSTGLRAASTTPHSGAMAKLAGQIRRGLRMSPGLKGEGNHSHLLPPLASLQIGISENGFHDSVSGNQLFTTLLPTNS